MDIRFTQASDFPALQTVLDQTGLFPSDMLPGMVADFLSDGGATDLWLTCIADDTAIGLCYARPEMLADGTWNMLAIAVHPDHQGKGAGAALTKHLEDRLRENNQRILIVDTSSDDAFSNTRRFYDKNGYAQEARIRDFWAPGDDKIIYWKKL